MHDQTARAAGKAQNGHRGGVAIMVALSLSMLLGFSALGTEIVYAMFKQRQMQATANSAALAGATAMMTGHPADPTIEARAVATTAGFTDGVTGARVVPKILPAGGSYAANTAMEVIIVQPQNLPLSSLFYSGTWNISARAVAVKGNKGTFCILALDPTASGALTLSNNASVSSTTQCGVAVNSTSRTALMLSENASISGPVSVAGQWSLANNAHLNGSPQLNGAPPVPDPYAGVSLGAVPACTGQSGSSKNNSKISLLPGHFCNGWDFSNNLTLTLAPGIYYIDSQLNVGNNANVTGSGGVTLVINGDYAAALGNNAVLNLTAPTTGPFAGLAIADLSTMSSVSQTFANNTSLSIEGAIYFRHQTVTFDNNGMTTPGSCTQIIARMVVVQNNAMLDNNCGGMGVQPIGTSPSRLVE